MREFMTGFTGRCPDVLPTKDKGGLQMPKWTYYLTVYNQLDRPFKLQTENIAWGRTEGEDVCPENFPRIIEPEKSGKYFVYAPAGTSTGIEFYLIFNDVAPAGKSMYGTVQVNVDMPYWKTKNTSSCKRDGNLRVDGFQEVPDGAHDFSTSVIVSRSVSSQEESGENTSTIDAYRDWESIVKLPIDTENSIRTLLPKDNVYQHELMVMRSEPVVIPPAQWDEIHDAELPDSYAKASSVDSYFCVCVYVLRRAGMLSIAAQQSIEKTETIEHSSSMRRSISETERLDTTLDVSGFSKAGSVMAHIGAAFELTTMSEYAEEDRRTTVVDIRYDPCEYDRDVVFWDVAKVPVLYREMKKEFKTPLVRMAALDDYYFETYQKTYNYKDGVSLTMPDNKSVQKVESTENTANTANMVLRLTGCITSTITAQNIQYRAQVMQYAHCYVCTGGIQVTGSIHQGVTLHRVGAVQAHCTVHNVNNGTEIRVTWTNGNNTCNVYISD